MHPELDLIRSIRPGLDILANEIVIALKKRTRFPVNQPVYDPGLVVSDPQLSLLDYELARVETVHAELGRYTFASQESFTPVIDVAPVIRRTPLPSPIEPMHSGMTDRVKAFYREWIDSACAPGEDEMTYGETVTADVNALLCILERINLGKFVAESKMADEPDQFRATQGNRDAIVALIARKDRESQVLKIAEQLADNYDVPAQQVVKVFNWMIEATIDIEVAYVRVRLGLPQA